MNSVNITGRLTRDVEFKTTPNGINVCNFGVAVQRNFKNANGEYAADFVNVICWRGTAEFARNNFMRGKWISIIGRLHSRSWADDNGTKHSAVDIIADQIEFCGDKSAAQGNGPAAAHTNQPTAAAKPMPETKPTVDDFAAAADDDYPF